MIGEDDFVNVSDIHQFLYFLDCLSVATHQKTPQGLKHLMPLVTRVYHSVATHQKTQQGLKLLIVDQCRCNDQGRNTPENPIGIERRISSILGSSRLSGRRM